MPNGAFDRNGPLYPLKLRKIPDDNLLHFLSRTASH
jgi:hypothetical protein